MIFRIGGQVEVTINSLEVFETEDYKLHDRFKALSPD